MNTSHTPVHFEIPVDDMKRAQTFYKELFGWEIKSAGDDFDDYYIVNTVPTDKNEASGKPGMTGGMLQKTNPDQPIINYISVEDIDAALAKVESLGGGILMPKMPVEGIGWNCVVKDTEGNTFGMIQKKSATT